MNRTLFGHGGLLKLAIDYPKYEGEEKQQAVSIARDTIKSTEDRLEPDAIECQHPAVVCVGN